jgi:hypothetical protein
MDERQSSNESPSLPQTPPPACCDSVLLAACCGEEVKPACCGPDRAPVVCGCGTGTQPDRAG